MTSFLVDVHERATRDEPRQHFFHYDARMYAPPSARQREALLTRIVQSWPTTPLSSVCLWPALWPPERPTNIQTSICGSWSSPARGDGSFRIERRVSSELCEALHAACPRSDAAELQAALIRLLPVCRALIYRLHERSKLASPAAFLRALDALAA